MRYRFQVSSADKVGPEPTYSIFSLTLASGCAVLLIKGSVEIDLGNGCLCEAGLVEVIDNADDFALSVCSEAEREVIDGGFLIVAFIGLGKSLIDDSYELRVRRVVHIDKGPDLC
jgi:hypothetical protein